ncbi:MAG: hypothetical protein LBU51_04045 [Bacteroidales bacterium]|jgi:hypothetical protein|nr:hypothetical protein [Bacteroidales bacterium]
MRRKNNDFYRQLEETTLENERLNKENKLLRGYKAEALGWQKEIEELRDSIDDLIEKAVEKATLPLVAKINEQHDEIMRLKSQLNKDSTNSSQPLKKRQKTKRSARA